MKRKILLITAILVFIAQCNVSAQCTGKTSCADYKTETDCNSNPCSFPGACRTVYNLDGFFSECATVSCSGQKSCSDYNSEMLCKANPCGFQDGCTSVNDVTTAVFDYCKPNTQSSSSPTSSSSIQGTYTTDGDYIKAQCSCKCLGKDLNASAIYKKGSETTNGIIRFLGVFNPLGAITGSITDSAMNQLEGQYALYRCQEQCSRSCGGYTSCAAQSDSECNTCCNSFCADSSGGYGGDYSVPCGQSCSSTCAYKGLINGIVGIIYDVAGIIGALMIVIHGIRMVTAEDAHDRSAAKSSIIYVILALIVIALAGTLVSIFMNSATIPQG